MLKIMNHMMMYSKRSKGETGITIPLKENHFLNKILLQRLS